MWVWDMGVICLMTKQWYNCYIMKIHGESKTYFYSRWYQIFRRCNDNKFKDYLRYGKRGIKVQWKSYIHFKKDMYESFLVHSKKYGVKNTTIERINVNGNYCKKNCIWTTWKKQSLNRRTSKYLTVNGITKNYSEWAEIIGCSRQALRYRVIHGLNPNLILTMPFKYSNKYAKVI